MSDQFSAFYTKVINTNARDAVNVIDGLLHHETDLTIEEHYTDTAGYTDKVFVLTHLLGFHFAPRLRYLVDSKLYAIGEPSDFPKLEKLLSGQINKKIIQENYDDVLRLAHSIREGTVSASLIMGKIGSYARQNNFCYHAARNGAYRENDLHPGSGEKIFYGINYVILSLAGLSCLIPLIHIISLSLSDSHAIMSSYVTLWPVGWSLESYSALFKGTQIVKRSKTALKSL